MQAYHEVKGRAGWMEVRKLRIGSMCALEVAQRQGLAHLERILANNSMLSKLHRVRIMHKGEVMCLVSYAKTRKDQCADIPEITGMDLIEAEGNAPQRSEGRFKYSQVSGGMRMSNVHNMVPGYCMPSKSSKKDTRKGATVTSRGRVMWNLKGEAATPKKAGKRKAPAETIKGSMAQFAKRNQSIEVLPLISKENPADRLDDYLVSCQDKRDGQSNAKKKLRSLKVPKSWNEARAMYFLGELTADDLILWADQCAPQHSDRARAWVRGEH